MDLLQHYRWEPLKQYLLKLTKAEAFFLSYLSLSSVSEHILQYISLYISLDYLSVLSCLFYVMHTLS